MALRAFATHDFVTFSGGQTKIRPQGAAHADLPGLDLESKQDLFHGQRVHGGAGGGRQTIGINLIDASSNTFKLQVSLQFGAFNIKCVSKDSDIANPSSVVGQQPLFISGFAGLPAAEERLFPLAIQHRLDRGQASAILRNLLLEVHQESPERFDRLADMMSRHFRFDLGRPSFSGDRDLHVHASYAEKISGRDLALDLSTAGSGFLQVLQILTPIYRYGPETGVVLLDEPDAHLHPNLQRTLAAALQDIAQQESIQILASTHSTAIIRSAAPEAVVPVTAGRKRLVPLGSIDAVEGEIASRLDNFSLAKASIAGKVVFVEDRGLDILRRVALLSKLPLFDGPSAVPTIHATGKDDPIPFRMRPTLKKLTGQDVEVLFVRDGDGMPPDIRDALVNYSSSKETVLVLLPFHEMESLLLQPAVVLRAIESLGVSCASPEVEAPIVESLTEVLTKSKYGFQRTLRDNIYKTQRLLKSDDDRGDAEKRAETLIADYEGQTEA